MGIEPTSQAWEARILPMNYTRIGWGYYTKGFLKMQGGFCRQLPVQLTTMQNVKCKMIVCSRFRISLDLKCGGRRLPRP